MSKIVKRFPLLASSQDPSQLSLTIKGILVALIPLVIALGQSQGWSVTEGDLMSGVEALVGVVSGCTILWGVIRKFRK